MARTRGKAADWRDDPGDESVKVYKIYTAKVGRPVDLFILSDKLTWVAVHFYNDRTRPCTNTSGPCEGCEAKADRRYKGYLASFDGVVGRACLAEVTKQAYLDSPELKEANGKLRGCHLRLERSGQAKWSRVRATLIRPLGKVGGGPPAFDVRAALEVIWWTDNPAPVKAANRAPRFDTVEEVSTAVAPFFRRKEVPHG